MKLLISILIILLMIPLHINALQDSSGNNYPIADADEDKYSTINGIVVLDGSKSYDIEDDSLNIPLKYEWYENSEIIGDGIVLKKRFNQGIHRISLKVTDFNGLISTDEVFVVVRTKETCKDTNAVYIPEDTICNKKWPSNDGKLLILNSEGYSCNLVEVCSEDLDYVIEKFHEFYDQS